MPFCKAFFDNAAKFPGTVIVTINNVFPRKSYTLKDCHRDLPSLVAHCDIRLVNNFAYGTIQVKCIAIFYIPMPPFKVFNNTLDAGLVINGFRVKYGSCSQCKKTLFKLSVTITLFSYEFTKLCLIKFRQQ